jgi:hypothetical protein
MDKIYRLFNLYDTAKDFSEYLTLEFVPIDTGNNTYKFNLVYGEILKHVLFYAYQFYTIYDMNIIETLSVMNIEADAIEGYSEDKHSEELIELVAAIDYWSSLKEV